MYHGSLANPRWWGCDIIVISSHPSLDPFCEQPGYGDVGSMCAIPSCGAKAGLGN